MTVAELIAAVLEHVRNQWYADRVREYCRDERALTKAIARYGFECDQRNWQFEPEFIRREIMQVLQEIKRLGADIHYFPLYLEGAIDRHIRQRAEELAAQAKTSGFQVSRTVAALPKASGVVIHQTPCEVLGTLYRDLRKHKRSRVKKQPKVEPQPSLF